ncbi:xaa-Pro aminopeptidase 3-like [Choristoneura fumiferana]|uniref:xaa-Pro aminopeptidase 3-like n=1 Tax=Choristoneura fumiferana TaxID=7141 RepID=UPI003D1587D9
MHSLRRTLLSTAAKSRRKITRRPEQSIRCMSIIDKPSDEKMVPKFQIPKGIMGQPTCHTHPHMIPPDFLTCGITQMEYKERREILVQKLLLEVNNVHKSHIIVIPAAHKQYMSDKIPYVFRQNSDFFYLTGCLEPAAVLVIIKPAQTDNFKSILFVHDKDSHAELWEGPRTGCASAAKLFAVDEARPIDNFATYMANLATPSRPLILWYNQSSNPELSLLLAPLRQAGATSGDPQKALHMMRSIKSPAEKELMKETCYIGSQAINMAMAVTKPGVCEHYLTAVLDYSARVAGAEHPAFPPVVAGGARATHIHYVTNNQLLTGEDMVLVDSGSQRWLYNSDISRTWPVSGKFSKHQRILYELILTVQKRLIHILGEHRPALDSLFDTMCRLLGTHLQQEGILPRNIDGNDLIGKAYRLCPHHVSHYLGLDVHDTPLVRRHLPVKTDMVVTVEPGIYIRPDDTSVPPEFRGIGIRIEDDVLITDSEPVVLTESCVKEVHDIEAIVGKHSISTMKSNNLPLLLFPIPAIYE